MDEMECQKIEARKAYIAAGNICCCGGCIN